MAEASLPVAPRSSWLDRPLAPSWQRLGLLLARWEVLTYGVFVLAGFLLRVWDVGSRAMHHDESLHAYYSWRFFTGQGYSYDPLMHGPLQFEVVPLFYLLFGDNEMAARMLAVVLGTVLIALPYFLRRYIGRDGALLASFMIMISPTLVYYSRFIRDDIYLACFTLALLIFLVRFMETGRSAYLYGAAAVAALAMASMEAAYIHFFIFGVFLLFEGIREYLWDVDGPVLRVVKRTPFDTWLTALSIFVVITVLLYSTFFSNPYGIWDSQHGVMDPGRRDILGGLTYWKAQHTVARGGQPWFYYLLVIPLYEQLAVLFGIAGLIYAAIRRHFVTTFIAWWAVMNLLLYSWAGEKMPWLSLHIDLPFILLAGFALNGVLRSGRAWLLAASAAAFVLLSALELHSTFALNFQDAANPTEMLIYVQTSQDVPNTVKSIDTLAARTKQGTSVPIGLDSSDVGGWPFLWYLRHYTNVTEATNFGSPACGGTFCPVLLLLDPEYTPNAAYLSKHYVAEKYRWNWWFPEDYKQWFPDHVGTLFGQGLTGDPAFGTSTDWQHLWNWLIYRKPFGDRGARWLYFLVRRDLVPGASSFSALPGSSVPSSPPPAAIGKELPARVVTTAGSSAGLSGPRGIASGQAGDLYVADTLNHRVVHFSASGALLGTFGTAGTATGQFSSRDSPQSLAVGPNGDVYVADTWNQRIEVFSAGGKFLRMWGGGDIGANPGQFYGPRSVAVSSTGRVYVADTGNKRIQVFTDTGKYLTSWGSAGSGQGQFNEPSAVAVGPDGTVYVADYWNGRIQAFTPNGRFLRAWPVAGWVSGSYDEPYLAVSRGTGNIFATVPGLHTVAEFTASGRSVGTFGSSTLTLPIGITVGAGGQVAVVDTTASQVSVFAVATRREAPARKTARKP